MSDGGDCCANLWRVFGIESGIQWARAPDGLCLRVHYRSRWHSLLRGRAVALNLQAASNVLRCWSSFDRFLDVIKQSAMELHATGGCPTSASVGRRASPTCSMHRNSTADMSIRSWKWDFQGWGKEISDVMLEQTCREDTRVSNLRRTQPATKPILKPWRLHRRRSVSSLMRSRYLGK